MRYLKLTKFFKCSLCGGWVSDRKWVYTATKFYINNDNMLVKGKKPQQIFTYNNFTFFCRILVIELSYMILRITNITSKSRPRGHLCRIFSSLFGVTGDA